jgi:hypothetical protein
MFLETNFYLSEIIRRDMNVFKETNVNQSREKWIYLGGLGASAFIIDRDQFLKAISLVLAFLGKKCYIFI